MEYKREPIIVDKYTVDQEVILGQGAYATVYLAYLSSDKSKQFAVKVMNISELEGKQKELYEREVQILKNVKGIENLAQVEDIHVQNNLCYFFFEKYGQNLEQFLEERKTQNEFKLEESLILFNQILKGYSELQKIGIIHRDLKPSNILLKGDTPYITDFGFAKIYEECEDLSENDTHTIIGTQYYMSPQILLQDQDLYQKEGKYTNKCDIWSLGIILFEMVYRQKPWQATNDSKLIKIIYSEPIDKVLAQQKDKNVTEDLKDLIENMLQKEEKDRLSLEELQEDFNKIFQKL